MLDLHFCHLVLKIQQGQVAGWHSRDSLHPGYLLNMLLMAETPCMQPT